MSGPLLSALVVAHNEEARLADCLERLGFADEIVVLLDRCTDASKDVAARFTDRIYQGAWDIEGERRNTGIDFCQGQWILEIDADEWVTRELAEEIRSVMESAEADIFDLPIDNHVGGRLIRHGWMTAMSATIRPSLFRKGVKTWEPERVHPRFSITGRKGKQLSQPLVHHMARNISDLLRRLDRNTTLRAKDLAERGDVGSFANMVRKIFSRFWKCYVVRRAYRENGHGFVIALCVALYPVISHLKATLEEGKS